MIEYTRLRLSQWGRWCRGREVTGYPTAAAFTHANEGDRARYDDSDFPPDIEEVERAVNLLGYTLRQCIVSEYVKTGPRWLRRSKLLISKDAYRRRIYLAERKIDQYLQEFAIGSARP